MKTNTLIKFHQEQIAKVINEAGRELPAMIISLILNDVICQVDKQVNEALKREYLQEESERKTAEEAQAKKESSGGHE